MKKNSEDHIQIYIVSFLKKCQIAGVQFLFWHTPNQGRNAAEGQKLKMMGVLSGVPDLVILADGFVHFIELKTENGNTSKNQDIFIASAAAIGHKTSVIRASGPADGVEKVAALVASLFPNHQGISSIADSIISSL